MATAKFYLDTRRVKQGNKAPLKIAITHKGSTTLLSTGISVPENRWDKIAEKVVRCENRQALNAGIEKIKLAIDEMLLKYTSDGTIYKMTATGLKNKLAEDIWGIKKDGRPRFAKRLLKFADSKKESTRQIYMHTYSRLAAFMGKDLDTLTFEDMTKEWLTSFDTFLQRTSPSKNARNIHFRNIRAVFNEALDDEIITVYPFRRFKIRPVATAKRSLSVGQLRTLFNAQTEEHAAKYLDMFKLIFCLIGINIIDLCNLKEIRDGRLEYYRAKTGRLYSIKVEPEALELIRRYPGKGQLLYMRDHYQNHKDYTRKLNYVLQHIGEVRREGLGGKKIYSPLFPQITSYWARHSWATIAASLGHGGNTVTDIYIDFDRNKVDEANRRVLDWVFYGKR